MWRGLLMCSYDADDIERIGLLRRKPVLQSMMKSEHGSRDYLLRTEGAGTRCGRCGDGEEV